MEMMDNIKIDVGIIKSDLKQLFSSFEKLDKTLVAFTKVIGEMSLSIALHDERINEAKKDSNEVKSTLKQRKEEIENRSKYLKTNIDGLREDFRIKISTLETSDINILEKIAEMKEENKENYDTIAKKLESHERIRWIIVGGGAVLVFAIDYIVQVGKGLFN